MAFNHLLINQITFYIEIGKLLNQVKNQTVLINYFLYYWIHKFSQKVIIPATIIQFIQFIFWYKPSVFINYLGFRKIAFLTQSATGFKKTYNRARVTVPASAQSKSSRENWKNILTSCTWLQSIIESKISVTWHVSFALAIMAIFHVEQFHTRTDITY